MEAQAVRHELHQSSLEPQNAVAEHDCELFQSEVFREGDANARRFLT